LKTNKQINIYVKGLAILRGEKNSSLVGCYLVGLLTVTDVSGKNGLPSCSECPKMIKQMTVINYQTFCRHTSKEIKLRLQNQFSQTE
jgi:hypothetical protein